METKKTKIFEKLNGKELVAIKKLQRKDGSKRYTFIVK